MMRDLWYVKMRGNKDPTLRPRKLKNEPFDRRYKGKWSPPNKPKRKVIIFSD